MTSFSQPVSSLPVGPIYGKLDIEQKTIDAALDCWIQSLAQPYFELISQTFAVLEKNPNRYEKEGFPYKSLSNGELSIPGYLVGKIRSGELGANKEEIRFNAGLNYKLDLLDITTPAGYLLSQIQERITKLGILCDEAEVRLEKGCYFSPNPDWHFDGKVKERFLSVCYSNIADWSTKILDEKDFAEIFSDGFAPYYLDFDVEFAVEQRAKNSEFDILYDVQKIYHRAPLEREVSLDMPASDYRLFLRFSKSRPNIVKD